MKPVLFVTGHAPRDRIGAFTQLHDREDVRFALFGGRLRHGPPATPGHAQVGTVPDGLPFPHRRIAERDAFALAASGRYRAVVCGTAGRWALPCAWAGARAGGAPFILWSSLWAHPRSLVHVGSRVALARLYRSADAVVTYGPHVSRYVAARGARNVHVARQSVDNAFWSAPADVAAGARMWPGKPLTKFLFVGRPGREKGLQVLLSAWRASGLAGPTAALVLVGVGSTPPWVPAGGAVGLPEPRADSGSVLDASVKGVGTLEQELLRNLYAAADVVVVPSISTPTFREPWGLVVNEAMNQRTPVIASDAVGAAAGGLVVDGRNGLVVPAGDQAALASAMRSLVVDERLRSGLGEQAALDVAPFTHAAWAEGFSEALRSVGAGYPATRTPAARAGAAIGGSVARRPPHGEAA